MHLQRVQVQQGEHFLSAKWRIGRVSRGRFGRGSKKGGSDINTNTNWRSEGKTNKGAEARLNNGIRSNVSIIKRNEDILSIKNTWYAAGPPAAHLRNKFRREPASTHGPDNSPVIRLERINLRGIQGKGAMSGIKMKGEEKDDCPEVLTIGNIVSRHGDTEGSKRKNHSLREVSPASG